MYFSNESKPRKEKYPMDALKTIRERRSARAFQPVSIPREPIEEILRLTINAPSANNLQPWEFVVVMDEEKDRLSRGLIKAYKEKQISCGSGAVKPLPKAIKQRGVQTLESMKPYADRIGASVDSFINEGSCNFYGAPVAIIICLDDCFSARQMVDVGTAVGYLVLAAQAFGLATCPIGLIADYADEIKDLLNIPENKKVVIGVALGYPDRENPMSQFKSSRADLSELVRWI
ncbi:MAG: nitroreductase [Dehalococcoidia bacterium]|nr:nitroreductase [Dehalococcoidia bacterium]